MKSAITADTHLWNHSAFPGATQGRMNDRYVQALSLVDKALELAVQQNCTHFFIAGDVFDGDHPFPDQLAAFIAVIRRWKLRIQIHLMCGNHDMHSAAPGDHAMAPLLHEEKVFVHEKPAMVGNILVVPFGYDPLEMRLVNADVVIAHHGISDESTLPEKAVGRWVREVTAIQSWMAAEGVTLYLSGDWHEHRDWGSVVQIGALAPVNWSNRAYVPGKRDPYGSVIIVDHVTPTRFVLPGPRFMRSPTLALAEHLRELGELEGCQVYVDLEYTAQSLSDEHRKYIRHTESATHKEVGVQQAAAAMRDGADMEVDLRQYVSQIETIPPDDKEAVYTLCLRALRNARA
jgi:hypothetical protein